MPRRPRTSSPSAGPPATRLVPGRAPMWRRRLLRHRRALAAVLVALLAWSLTSALRPPAAETVAVLVAARDLQPGTLLSDADVAPAALPAAAVPVDALPATAASDRAALDGRTVVVPVRAGEPLLVRHLLTSSLLAGFGPDIVATPVRLSDDAAAVVRPGDLVDVVAAVAGGAGDGGGSSAVVVASRVRVLLAGDGTTSDGGGALSALGSGADRSATVVVLATTQQQGLALARAAVGARLSVLLRDG